MNPLPLLLLFPLFLSCIGCSAIKSSPKEERAKVEMALRKMRTDLDEVKHDLNSHQMELHILEGKVLSQEHSLFSLKEQTVDAQQSKLSQALGLLANLEKKSSLLEKRIEEALIDIRKLSLHANETTTALTQYQDKINEVQDHINHQNNKLQEINTLKTAVRELLQGSTQALVYVVKSGDTLERIAKNHGTTIEALKRINKVQDDMIYSGQELLIPAAN